MHLLERGIAAPGSIANAQSKTNVAGAARNRAALSQRTIEPEFLDDLPPADPRAIRARRDLHRVNTVMRNHAMMANLLRSGLSANPPKQIADLGAGAGDFMLGVARRLAPEWRNVNLRLIDRQDAVHACAITKFAGLGWRAEFLVRDVFDWLHEAASNPPQVVVANLFLHEFSDARLAAMLRDVAELADLFVAIEPRRAAWPLFCSRLLWLAGCNRVSRHDGVASVRGGFTGRELSALWPANDDWILTEGSAGLFGHAFAARRRRLDSR